MTEYYEARRYEHRKRRYVTVYRRRTNVTSTVEEREAAILAFLSDGQPRRLSEVRKALELGSHEAAYAWSALKKFIRQGRVERVDNGYQMAERP